MAGAKEIRTKIASVKSTQKITKAMEMVAASKMRKTQDTMEASRPYSDTIRKVIGHVALAHLGEYKHPYLDEREVKRIGYIIISTDRGLCGGLNVNLFKPALKEMEQWNNKGVEIDLVLIGSKAISFFHHCGGNIVAQTSGLGDKPELDDLVGAISVMLDKYDSGHLDRIEIVFNRFVNTMVQKAMIQTLIPLPISEDEGVTKGHAWDYIYEPDSKMLLNMLLRRYIEAQVYQGVVDNLACEQAARMMAMNSATDNAGDIIEDLELIYNKARQASITQELTEIVSGASAV